MREINVTRISILSNRLQAIDAAKKELIRLLRELEVESKAKQIELNLLRNENAAVSLLPNEILALIFEFGRHVPHGYPYRLGRNPRFEVLVSHVTHHWRRVALSTPMLWTEMHRTKYQQEFKSILAYLRRSNPVAFQLKISIGADEGEDSDTDDSDSNASVEDSSEGEIDDITPFYRLISPHLHRCRDLFIESDSYPEGVEMLRYLSSTHAPLLRSISLAYSNGLSGVPLNLFADGAQFLTHVYLAGVALLSCLPPMVNVTTLRLDRYGWPRNATEVQTIAKTLSTMPALTYLELGNCNYGTEWPPLVSLNLPVLRRLVYDTGGTTSDQLSSFLVALNAPLLEDLTLDIFSLVNNVLEALALAGPLRLPSVRRLCLSRGFESISIPNMRRLAQAFPFIIELTHSVSALYHRTTRTPEFLTFLQEVDPKHGIAWPRLLTLAIPISISGAFPVADFESLLVKRADFGCPIQTLILPGSHLEQKSILSSCTQPEVQIMQYTDDVLNYFPGMIRSSA